MKPLIQTCTSLDCPERKSVCCGLKSRAKLPAIDRDNAAEFVCSGCGKDYVGGKCNADKPLTDEILEEAVKEIGNKIAFVDIHYINTITISGETIVEKIVRPIIERALARQKEKILEAIDQMDLVRHADGKITPEEAFKLEKEKVRQIINESK